MIVTKEFKNVNQVFKVGDEIYEDVEGLEKWVAAGFVELEKIVTDNLVTTTVTTDVPTVTYA